VDQYITDVATTEDRQLAAGDARAQQQVAAGRAETQAADLARDETPPPVPEKPEQPADMFQATEGRWGSREVEVTGVTFVGEDGTPTQIFHSGERIEVRVKVRAARPTADFVFGVGLLTAQAVLVYGTNTNLERYEPHELAGEGEFCLVLDHLDLVEGTYKVDVAVHRTDGYPYDYHRLLHSFRVKSQTKDVGIYRPPHTWSFSPTIRFRPSAQGCGRDVP
jgi:hypothetical protein